MSDSLLALLVGVSLIMSVGMLFYISILSASIDRFESKIKNIYALISEIQEESKTTAELFQFNSSKSSSQNARLEAIELAIKHIAASR
jgi:ABC-type bacteriocin/lantibiotic exporter with double-glycine peptidase domain